MLQLAIDSTEPLRVLVVGAHPDDIEIGCGATILSLIETNPAVDIDWVVATGCGERADEARRSSSAFASGARRFQVHMWDFRDGFLPFDGARLKDQFEGLKRGCRPDVVLTHYREDRHQDHRMMSDFSWNTFRDSLVLEYEIPKWDGDLGTPNLFVEVEPSLARRKVDLLNEHFPSQRARDWFDDETFFSMMRIRGMECRASSRLAEAFYARKVLLNPSSRKEILP